jgi:hypothetical protein
MIENSVWSPMLGAFFVPRSPVHGRQIPAVERLPKHLHASVRAALRQAWELDDAEKAERLPRERAISGGGAG